MNKYEEIINLKHHESKIHHKMNLEDRAAQFSPFAALTGYEDEIKEIERFIEQKIELDENEKEIINNKLNRITNNSYVKITYFLKDLKKIGGEYLLIEGNINKIDKYKNIIIINNSKIPFDDIIDIEINV